MTVTKDTIIIETIAETKDAEKKIRNFRQTMLGVGLSFLFTGMAMARTFESISKSSLSTFNKLVSDTDMANNATNRLAGGLEAIKYTIGEALNTAFTTMEPFLQNIIQYIINITNKHPELMAHGIIWGWIGSKIMEVVGNIMLFLIGITYIFPKLVLLGAGFKTLGVSIATASASFSSFIATNAAAIGAAAGLLAIFVAIFGLLTGNKVITEWVGNIVGGIAFIVGYIIFIVKGIIVTIAQGMAMAGKAVWYIIKLVGQNMVNFAIEGLNKIIGFANKIASFLGLGEIATSIEKVNWTKNGMDIGSNLNIIKQAWSTEELGKYTTGAFTNTKDTFITGMGIITDFLGTNLEKQSSSTDKFSDSVDKFSNVLNIAKPGANQQFWDFSSVLTTNNV